jgi:heme/copper-type cytochrome/quinol oxidase subunit 1
MGIGGSIFLIALGAILAFAVADMISGVDLTMIGYILMVAGVIWLIASLIINQQRRNTRHTEYVERHDDRHVRGPGEPL